MQKNYMKKTPHFFLTPILFWIIVGGCNSNGIVGKNDRKDSANTVSIKYPLPKSIDSLFALLKTVPDDTDKANILSALGQTMMYAKPDTTIILFNQVLQLSEKLQWKKGISRAYGTIGICNYLKGDYPNSLENFQKALKIDEEQNSKKGITSRLSNIGLVYTEQGNYPKAMDSYLKALKIAEEEGDKNTISAVLGNLGLLSEEQKDYKKALDYELRALKICEELKNKYQIAANLGNIGVVYQDQANNDKALEYYFKYLKMAEEIGNKGFQGTALDNIGIVYADLAKIEEQPLKRDTLFKKALDFYFKALKMDGEIGKQSGIASVLGNVGSVYFSQGKYNLASIYYYRALAISDSIGILNSAEKLYELLSTLYEKSNVVLPDSIGGKMLDKEGIRLRSLYYFKRAMNLRDTLFSEENKKQLVRKEMNFDFEKKEAATKADQDKKDALA